MESTDTEEGEKLAKGVTGQILVKKRCLQHEKSQIFEVRKSSSMYGYSE